VVDVLVWAEELSSDLFLLESGNERKTRCWKRRWKKAELYAFLHRSERIEKRVLVPPWHACQHAMLICTSASRITCIIERAPAQGTWPGVRCKELISYKLAIGKKS